MTETRISGKVLAQLNMPDFCPRCFWIKQKVKKLPYQIFPGIFSSIDAYSKRVMHAWFNMFESEPSWLPELHGVIGYLPVPHWSKFKRLDPKTRITVSGAMDDLFVHKDGTHIIPDYKTAKFTANADKLFPLYVGQLNAYRWIHEGFGHIVSSLPLIYCEPVTDESACSPWIFNDDGFSMGFSVKVLQVPLTDSLVHDLLEKAADILAQVEMPASVEDCKDCASLYALVDVVKDW